MKNKKYHDIGTVSKSNRKMLETEVKLIPLKYKYMTAHFPGLIQVL